MRILGVRFKNLNSLAGEWQIDFTSPAYASDGIFAITGPTGSGKTTILDAICLGLYGRTPRLDKVTKSSNEIMSRQTGQCFAEVTFETQKGRYRCHWSQHRSRKKSTGDLQPARHEVVDAATGVVLESRITQVAEFIEKTTGMDFDRFTRSMLLAQGGFAAFLQATPDNRAPILEQITGTEIYSLISMKVHERRRDEQEKLDLLQAEFKGIMILSGEEEEILQAELKEKQELEAALSGKLAGLNQSLLWLNNLISLEKDIAELDRQAQEFKERSNAFAPEAQKLERARKALSLEGDYRNIVNLRTQQAAESRELSDALAALPDKEKIKAAALLEKQAADARLIEARNTQNASLDIIKKVREHDARISEQKKQLEEKKRALAALEGRSSEYKSGLEKISQALQKAKIDLETIHEYQRAHAADAGLGTQLPVIIRSCKTLSELETRCLLAREASAETVVKKNAAEAAGKKAEARHEECRRKLDAGQIEQQRLAEEMAAILQGREMIFWRSVGDNLKDRERLLIEAGATGERIGQTRHDLENLKTLMESLKFAQEKLFAEIKDGANKKETLEKEISSLEIQVSLLSRIRSLEAERRLLEDGKECPLCGALDHPYAKGNIPQINDAESALKKTKADFKKAAERQNKLEAKLAELKAEIRHKENELAQKTINISADEQVFADVLAKLNIEVAPAMSVDFLRKELAAVGGELAKTNNVITRADALAKKEAEAHKSLEKLRAQFDAAVSAVQESRIKLETANLEYAQLSKSLTEMAGERNKMYAALLQDLEPFGIKQVLSPNIDTFLKELAARHHVWQKKQNEKAITEKKIADLEAEIVRVQSLLASLEKDLSAGAEERAALQNVCHAHEELRRAEFGEKNADEEEKRLAATVETALKYLQKCGDNCSKYEQEFIVLQARTNTLNDRTTKRAQELEEGIRLLNERFRQAGFTNEADYLGACLSEEERESMANREKELVREKTQLETRHRDKSAALAVEKEKNITDQSLETIKESITLNEAKLKQMSLDIGGVTRRLDENEKQKADRQERLQAIENRKKECARWNELHDLIGSADGKKFRNFAQGLTFEMMTAQANRQLRKMTDRYLLIHDAAQPLELNVIDNYQAGEIRSTRNLSGGESFIVSLALALGLSQMASRNVRVDSLFLDEGFGTLDDDALETALETLAGLRRGGKLIGVISHVPALKERISTQITVKPETGGCSTITGPGCRRL
ncbi:MAG: AAA family ATPase [Smithellaceae bacterium]